MFLLQDDLCFGELLIWILLQSVYEGVWDADFKTQMELNLDSDISLSSARLFPMDIDFIYSSSAKNDSGRKQPAQLQKPHMQK